MVQRAKTLDSRLSVVAEQAESTVAPAAEPPASQEAPVQDNAASTAAAAPASGLKTNRKPILVGVAALLLVGIGYFTYNYVTVGRFMVSTTVAKSFG